tara:strand:+ start:3016 stop:3483 length:468 start_codon:yes stop_codon:yes gene_type:complete
MPKLEIRDAEVGDGITLAPNLRQADKDEMKAATGQVGPDSLERGIRDCDQCWCAEVEGEPVCLYGYMDSGDGSAFIWLMGSDIISDVSWQFLRASKHTMKKLSHTYDSLWSLADIRNTTHQEWYEWLGFKVLNQVKAGPEGRTFNLIEWRKENNV